MPSITNIPDHLKYPGRKTDFISWLSQQPIEYPIRRSYAAAWTRITGATLTREDWLLLQNTAPQPGPPHA